MNQAQPSNSSKTILDSRTIVPARDVVKSLGDVLATRSTEPDLPLKTMPGLSKAMWGLPTKSLMCVAARTSQGKSAWTCQLLYDLAVLQGYPCVYMSLEMTPHSVMERMFCLHASVHNEELQRGGFQKYHKEWFEFCNKMRTAKLMISDGLGKTWKELDQMIEDFGSKPRVVVLDYIQMINGAGVERKEVIDEYLKHFRRLAIQNDFCGIVVSQINRASENSKDHVPHLWNLSGTSGLEDISDRVALLHWPHHYDNSMDINAYDVYIAKNRAGKTGKYSLRFVPEFFRFEEPRLLTSVQPEVEEVAKMFNAQSIHEVTRYKDN